MTANLDRTISRWTRFYFSDGSAMRNIPVNTINGIGLNYPEVEVYAFLDVIRGVLLDTPDCAIDIQGPFTNEANSAHAVLNAANGVMTPRSLDVQVGIQHAWESGEPQFGVTATATSGFVVSQYIFDPSTGLYSARFRMKSNSAAAPAWGTAAEAVS